MKGRSAEDEVCFWVEDPPPEKATVACLGMSATFRTIPKGQLEWLPR
jgi:hypothetical protein